MRPILMAGSPARQSPLSYSPAPDDGLEANGGSLIAFVIDASQPVVWNWSASGASPSSSVANGGTSSRITFTLTNSTFISKSCTIIVTSNGNQWTINLTAEGRA